ncbi:Protein YIP [Mycena venus]|uniref:Protein YIP n=1 Tax=Mycena venus TaxID=2733690 RepID=A0A8H7CMD1_9AGAR|nr:Protein YIP [Mycena venus]
MGVWHVLMDTCFYPRRDPLPARPLVPRRHRLDLSGWFLFRNVYPILASAEADAMRLLIVVVAALHAGLAIAFKVVVSSNGADPPSPSPSAPAGNDTVPEVCVLLALSEGGVRRGAIAIVSASSLGVQASCFA